MQFWYIQIEKTYREKFFGENFFRYPQKSAI